MKIKVLLAAALLLNTAYLMAQLNRDADNQSRAVSFTKKAGFSVTVPMTLDHNRMLVEAEIMKKDGTWRKVLLWVDTGNPDFIMSESLATDLGIDLSAKQVTAEGQVRPLEITAPSGVRVGTFSLDFQGIKSKVMFEPKWIFRTMHVDGNIPSTVLRQYQVIFDYPEKQLTLAAPGSIKPVGFRCGAGVSDKTGIVQIDAVIGNDSLSFALDNGASYSFISEEDLNRLTGQHPGWPVCKGAAGCANIWGWWPLEESWTVSRIPEITIGQVRLSAIGMVGLPAFFGGGAGLGEWYSQKTARPVVGFLGPNALKNFRVEFDYADKAVYFEKKAPPDMHDMDLVGLTLRLTPDGDYQVVGVAQKDGVPVVKGMEPGDILLRVGQFKCSGETMGKVIDALRGNPGEERLLTLTRNAVQFQVSTKVDRLL